MAQNNPETPAQILVIRREEELVAQGKSPKYLLQLLQECQFGAFTYGLDKRTFNIYAEAFVLNHDFISLDLLFTRYRIQNKTLTNMAYYAVKSQFKQLLKESKNYQQQTQSKFKNIIHDAVIEYVVAQYAQNYINYDYRKLQEIGITKKWLENHDYNFDGNYVIMKQKQCSDQNIQHILKNRMKQIAKITEKMLELGKDD